MKFWLAGLHRQSDKIILQAFPEVPVVLFEDGLASYYKPEVLAGLDGSDHCRFRSGRVVFAENGAIYTL